MIPVTRTEITPGTANNWIDVDVTSYVGDDAGSVAGVMLEAVNKGVSNHNWGVRKNGSSDNRYYQLLAGSHSWIAIGVDSGDIFDCFVADIDDIDIFIIGYIKNTEGSFFTNGISKQLGSSGSWLDINISEDTEEDTAVCAFFEMHYTGSSAMLYGFRENGSEDTRYGNNPGYGKVGAMMSVDVNEIVECVVQHTSLVPWLVGYLTDNCISWANAKDYSTATLDTWVDVDMSSDIPSGNDGAFLHFHVATTSYYLSGIRKNGAEIDNYYKLQCHQYLWCEIDSGRIAEQKIESTGVDLWLWGYTSQPVAPPPSAEPALFFSHNF